MEPSLCTTCGECKHIVKSTTAIAGGGEEFWYCRNCKIEIDSMGYPKLDSEYLDLLADVIW